MKRVVDAELRQFLTRLSNRGAESVDGHEPTPAVCETDAARAREPADTRSWSASAEGRSDDAWPSRTAGMDDGAARRDGAANGNKGEDELRWLEGFAQDMLSMG